MIDQQERRLLIQRLLEKADQAIESSLHVYDSGDIDLSSNRVYYACFYALNAVLLSRHIQFGRHSSVRGALHQHLVKTGVVSRELGRFYDTAFSERQEADYNVMATFDPSTVKERISTARQFVERMKELVHGDEGPLACGRGGR